MNSAPRILGIIPARAGSKAVPGKNMKRLGGKPLIQYTIESAQKSQLLDKIVVSSDCERTVGFARRFSGIEAPFKRPAQFSEDHSPSLDVVRHALNYYLTQHVTFDYVVLLQPTSPFRSFDLIDKAILHILENGSDSLVTVQKIPDRFSPYWALQPLNDTSLGFINFGTELIARRQELPDTYYRDGKIYITKVSLIQKGLLLGGKISGLITKNESDINIDTPYDWRMANQELLRRGKKEQKDHLINDHK